MWVVFDLARIRVVSSGEVLERSEMWVVFDQGRIRVVSSGVLGVVKKHKDNRSSGLKMVRSRHMRCQSNDDTRSLLPLAPFWIAIIYGKRSRWRYMKKRALQSAPHEYHCIRILPPSPITPKRLARAVYSEPMRPPSQAEQQRYCLTYAD